MAKRKTEFSSKIKIESILHEEATRKNIPTAEFQSIMQKTDQASIRASYARRNRDLDPQLVWRGKDLQDESDLTVPVPPLYIQEKVHPKVLIDEIARKSSQVDDLQINLFADFNGLPTEGAKTEFYQHEAHWANRLILGDSLQVMASLAEREGLKEQVQCIYFDPPYGISFNSNFQWSTTSRDVKDTADHITREPEQVKAFRDTWRDGIHSYLSYLRDRLTVARDLLAPSGSIFVQIGAENVHRVRAVLDEVFGDRNCITEILVKKKGSQKGGTLDPVNDFILWYGKSEKSSGKIKIRPVYEIRDDAEVFSDFPHVELPNGERLSLSDLEERDKTSYRTSYKTFKDRYPGARLFALNPLKSGGDRRKQSHPFKFRDRTFPIRPGQCWKHTVIEDDDSTPGMTRLGMADRLYPLQTDVRFVRHSPEPSIREISNWWDGFGGAQNQVYVVQTNERVVERCLLMATDPGDLVLDPTCGSGTTATVAEQWGRRWITIDTSRVALALARARIMGAKYPYYILADSEDGKLKEAEITKRPISTRPTSNNIRLGFVYERAFNVTSGSIANNSEIEVIHGKWKELIDPKLKVFNELITPFLKKKNERIEEWNFPLRADETWTKPLKTLHEEIVTMKSEKRKEMQTSVSRNADFELLFDRPYENKKVVRVAGPFTVESLSPHRSVGVDEKGELLSESLEPVTENNFLAAVLENLRTSGVQQAHKEDKISFTSMSLWPGTLICAEGKYLEANKKNGQEKRAAVFVGPEFGTVSRPDLVAAAREAGDSDFDVLIACAFNFDAHSSEFEKLGRIPVLKARINADLHMAQDLKNTGAGNLFVVFGEPDIDLLDEDGKALKAQDNKTGKKLKPTDKRLMIKVNGVDVFQPNTGEVRSDGPDGIACWFVDTDYNEESFFVRHAYFLGANDPYKSLKNSLKAEIDEATWETLHSDTSRPFDRPQSGRIAVKVINHLGDEVMKIFRVE